MSWNVRLPRIVRVGCLVSGLAMAVVFSWQPQAAGAASTPRLRVLATGPRRIAPGGTVIITGRVTGGHARRLTFELFGSKSAMRAHRSASSPGSFMFSFRAPRRSGVLRVRVLVRQAHRTIGRSQIVRVNVHRGAPTTASPHTAVSVVPSGAVSSAPRPGRSGRIVLSGRRAFQPGSVIASSVGPGTPNGLLAKVVSVSTHNDVTTVQTEPTTIEAALPAGSFDLSNARRVTGQVASARRRYESTGAPGRAAHTTPSDDGGTFTQRLAKSFSCSGNATFDATGSASLDATPTFKLSWSPFHGVSASFTETVKASASLSGSVTAAGDCSLDRTPVLAHPKLLGTFEGDVLGLPVVVAIKGQLYLDGNASASGSVSAGVSGSITAHGGIAYSHGHASLITPGAGLNYQVQGPTVQASASLGAHITPELQALLYGVGGPVFDATTGLDFNADTSLDPWWTLTAPLTVTAKLAAPDFDLSTPTLTLYHHTFTLAHAPGGFVTQPPPQPTVPLTGPTLVDEESTAGDPTSGDQTFNAWSSATGEEVDVLDALPSDMSSYRCVVLDINELLDPSDPATLATYLGEGGTVIALGEHTDGGGGFDEADATLNALASQLGSGITLNDDEIDASDTTTNNIDSSPLTVGVGAVGYNWASTLSVPSPASALVESADDSATLIASDSVDGGTLIVSGDSNAFSDNNDGFYSFDDNGQLVDDFCP
jgi:hypothetical protein